MQSKLFSKLALVTAALICLGILVVAGKQAAENVPFPPLGAPTATSTEAAASGMATTDVRAPGGIIHALVASSPVDQERGLGGRQSLASDAGMLFAFPDASVRGFWMKDMQFPIDIIWVDAAQKVVGIAARVAPGSYPDIFFSPSPVATVLELNSGGAAAFGIATGTQLVF